MKMEIPTRSKAINQLEEFILDNYGEFWISKAAKEFAKIEIGVENPSGAKLSSLRVYAHKAKENLLESGKIKETNTEDESSKKLQKTYYRVVK